MMKLGSGVITDLDRFVMGPNSDCDVYGEPLEGTAYYDEETKSKWGYTEWQGERFKTQWFDNGRTTIHTGGPCGSMEFDEHGEMM
ncbi:hypothetical protein PMW_168 [Pseudomonas phage phiPMW]|uniref:Uncharacterized protein n=1 Tax=Pseudomonas phage phiPMW TaxID=1815582 RepID=A0A1S5R1L3_9CAUD|nr:hypothetical protein FDG97_gp182 [Pseudomonas phage phiPMW]ANA49293.1 hypothetical protein PMW_168 [Pseudomonas phage phiPMW]